MKKFSRVIALAMSAICGFSTLSAGMPSGTAYAVEPEEIVIVDDSAETETSEEEVFHDESESEDQAADKATSETEPVADETTGEEVQESAGTREFDASKTDVWDFGAEKLGANYNN